MSNVCRFPAKYSSNSDIVFSMIAGLPVSKSACSVFFSRLSTNVRCFSVCQSHKHSFCSNSPRSSSPQGVAYGYTFMTFIFPVFGWNGVIRLESGSLHFCESVWFLIDASKSRSPVYLCLVTRLLAKIVIFFKPQVRNVDALSVCPFLCLCNGLHCGMICLLRCGKPFFPVDMLNHVFFVYGCRLSSA